MSLDNGIYVLESVDGFRVAEAFAIDNIFLSGNTAEEADTSLLYWFGKSQVFEKIEDAITEAGGLLIQSYEAGHSVEYGIQLLKLDRSFP